MFAHQKLVFLSPKLSNLTINFVRKNKAFKSFNSQLLTRQYKIASFQYELLKTNESKAKVIRKPPLRFTFFKIDKYICVMY